MSIEPIEMTQDSYLAMTESYNGLCLECGETREGGCEPDAEKYECYSCGAHAVMGAENAMMAGHIEIVD
jgi:hypothetical protein